MERVFESFGHLARHAREIQVFTNAAVSVGLLAAAEDIHTRMKPMFGEYQNGAGPFADWEPLKEATLEDRERKGFAPDEPLLRTGDLRDSYEVAGGFLAAGVGSSSIKAYVQEVGDPTHNLPARSTLGIAFVRSERTAFAAALIPIEALYLTGKRVHLL